MSERLDESVELRRVATGERVPFNVGVNWGKEGERDLRSI